MNRDYFNVDIETQTDIRKAICFSPSKRKLFEEAALNRSGCEIQNAHDNADKTLFVSDYSTVKTADLGFPRTNSYKYLTVSEVINEVQVDQKVNVRGLVVLNDTKYVTVAGKNDVPIREGHIIDETASMKITVWREYINIPNNVTYNFLDLLKVRYGAE